MSLYSTVDWGRGGRRVRRGDWCVACLKCERRPRLLPIHLAQDGRQIELPFENQEQRAWQPSLFLPSFPFSLRVFPLHTSSCFSLCVTTFLPFSSSTATAFRGCSGCFLYFTFRFRRSKTLTRFRSIAIVGESRNVWKRGWENV